jgi:hypothetical protein
MPGTVRLIDPQGQIRDVPSEAAAGALEAGWRAPTTQEELGRTTAQAQEEAYGGVGGAVKAGAAGLARGISLGGFDAAARLLGGEDAAIELQGLRETNPGVSIGTEIVGGVAPALVSGGAALPAGAAARVGAGIGRAAGGGIRGAIVAGTTEGAIQGFGQGVTELALSTDPLTIERAASALSSNMLYGAGFGAAAGGLAKGAELGLARAKGAIDDALERRAAKATTAAEAIEQGDLSLLDKRTLDLAEKDEIQRIQAERAPQRKALVDELDGYRNDNRDAHELREIAKNLPDVNIREAGGSFARHDIKLKGLLDNKVGFAKDPERARPLLQAQAQALEEITDHARAVEMAWKKGVAEAPEVIRKEILAGKVSGELGPFTASGLDLAVERELKARQGFQWNGAVHGGIKEPAIVRYQQQYADILDWNRRFQAQLDELAKPPTSDRLAKIAEARAVLEQPKEPSLGDALLGAATPFAGPLGVAAAAGGRVLGSFRKLASAAAERTGRAVSGFLGAAGKAAEKGAPLAPVIATKVLSGVRFAPGSDAGFLGAAGKAAEKGAPLAPVIATKVLSGVRFAPGSDAEERRSSGKATTLASAYRARTDEIKSQTAYDAAGVPRMRTDARAEVAERLKPVRAVDPILADRMETIAARRIEYLSSILPRRPDIAGAPIGPDNWQPSDMEMRAFARSVAAVEDPYAVLERAAHGAVTPEDVDALRAVYPELLADFTASVAAELPTLRKTLSPAKKLSLSILTGVPVDPAMDPAILRTLQAQYQYEEPKPDRATAQFGSVKNRTDLATPSQRREEGVAQ